jgi:hypothetical protein
MRREPGKRSGMKSATDAWVPGRDFDLCPGSKLFMKYSRCDGCGQAVFFKNDRCLKCGCPLGFLSDTLTLSSLESAADGWWRPRRPDRSGPRYRHCANGRDHQVCNWMVPENDPNPLCAACRLNEVIPDLSDAKNRGRWAGLELAKRRCVYTFLNLKLPLEGAPDQGRGPLRFRFLQDAPNAPALTGHENGVITVNILEADDDERERRRLALHEPYRTLVGHLRHESGHYYWDCLIARSPRLGRFRELFGDETADYEAALKQYYAAGAAADWPTRTVTEYASAHPWEDWAETWAHYLHIMDTLETAASYGLSVNPDQPATLGLQSTPTIIFNRQMDFDRLMSCWIPLTGALNSINRGMGLPDLYPFVIGPVAVEKLRFIHQVVGAVPAANLQLNPLPNPPPPQAQPAFHAGA